MADPTAPIPIITTGRTASDVLEEHKADVNKHVKPWQDGLGTLAYPLHKQDRYNAKITFMPIVIIPPSGATSVLGDLLMDTSYWSGFKSEDKAAIDAANKKKSSELKPRTEKMTGEPIKLYLPVAYTVNDGFDYATSGIGVAGSGAMNLMSAGGSPGQAIMGAVNSGVKSVVDFMTGSNAGDIGRLGLVRGLASSKMPSNLQNAVSLAVGVSVNPNVRAVFGGVSLREFAFQFKFVAKSAEEAQEVENIIKRFRVCAYPESIEYATGISGGYKYPFLFDITLNYDVDGGLPKRIGTRMEKCFLKAISTNYNPSSMSFHADGQPVEIDLSLTFVEQKTIDKKMVRDNGY